MPHQGHGPRADQTGRIHISDFRFPAHTLLRAAADPYIWVTPWQDILVRKEDGVTLPMSSSRRPRAFGLPYTRELHQKVDTMRERLARGELVIGSHESGDGWKRRFGMNHGQTNLEAPPSPPLPAKDG